MQVMWKSANGPHCSSKYNMAWHLPLVKHQLEPIYWEVCKTSDKDNCKAKSMDKAPLLQAHTVRKICFWSYILHPVVDTPKIVYYSSFLQKQPLERKCYKFSLTKTFKQVPTTRERNEKRKWLSTVDWWFWLMIIYLIIFI